MSSRNRVLVGMLAIAASFTLCGHSLRADPPHNEETYFRPKVPMRTFRVAKDGLKSPEDARLSLPDGLATIEFWLKPDWMQNASNSTTLMYCVLSDLRTSTRPDATPTPTPGQPATATPGYHPRFAVYINDDALFFQTGNTVTQHSFDAKTVQKIKDRNRIYFVLTFDSIGIHAYADGESCANFVGVSVPALSADDANATGRVMLGGKPEAGPLGKVVLNDVALSTPVNPALDLAVSLREFRGDLGGLRIWSKAYDPVHFTGADPPMCQRGPEDVQRSIKFPDVNNDLTQPKYSELIVYGTAEKSDHRIVVQTPISGHWVNDANFETKPAAEIPKGLDDAYGNADDYPLMTILPSGDPRYWYVYQDANLLGMIVPSTSGDGLEFTSDSQGSGIGIRVEVGEDSLLFRSTTPTRLLGGNKAGAGATRIKLRRPSAEWIGGSVRANNGFYTQGIVNYNKTAYYAWDLTSMDPLHAYQAGKTGSPKLVFAEPDGTQYNYDTNAGGAVVPFGFRYVNIQMGSGKTESTLCTNAAEFSAAFAMHAGASIDVDGVGPTFSASIDVGTKFKKDNAGKSTNSIAITKSFNRDFMLTLDKSQARLSADFIQEMGVLRRAADRARSQPKALLDACDDFVEVWGTHYSIATTFGGMMVHEREFSETDVRTATMAGVKIDAELKVGAKEPIPLTAATASQSVGLKFGMESEINDSKQNIRNKSIGTVTYVPTGKTLIGDPGAPGNLSYQESVPLFFDLRPIYDLLSPAYFDDPVIIHTVREALRDRTQEYLKKKGVSRPFPPAPDQPWLVPGGMNYEVEISQATMPALYKGTVSIDPVMRKGDIISPVPLYSGGTDGYPGTTYCFGPDPTIFPAFMRKFRRDSQHFEPDYSNVLPRSPSPSACIPGRRTGILKFQIVPPPPSGAVRQDGRNYIEVDKVDLMVKIEAVSHTSPTLTNDLDAAALTTPERNAAMQFDVLGTSLSSGDRGAGSRLFLPMRMFGMGEKTITLSTDLAFRFPGNNREYKGEQAMKHTLKLTARPEPDLKIERPKDSWDRLSQYQSFVKSRPAPRKQSDFKTPATPSPTPAEPTAK